jgi:hypothetical protein
MQSEMKESVDCLVHSFVVSGLAEADSDGWESAEEDSADDQEHGLADDDWSDVLDVILEENSRWSSLHGSSWQGFRSLVGWWIRVADSGLGLRIGMDAQE